jgi:hypothetical protein
MTKVSTVSKSKNEMVIQISMRFEKSMMQEEDEIQKALNEAGVLMTGAALEQFDTDGTPVYLGSTKLTSKGLVGKSYQTPYGEVRIARHVYQSSKGGRSFCPLEREARMILTATPKFAKMITSKYAETSATGVARDFEENHQRPVTRSFMQNVCDAVGAVAFATQDSWGYTLPQLDKRIASVAIGLDGTCTHILEDGYRQTMVGTIALFDKNGERQHTIYTAAAPEYGKATFTERFEREIVRIKEKLPNARYVGIADGAKDNWQFLERHTDVQLLDFWHASEYLSSAGEALFAAESEVEKRDIWFEKNRERLKQLRGAAGKIANELTQEVAPKKVKPEVREEVTKTITYFNNNKHRMNYSEALAQKLPIGSGVTEAACKVIVKQRLSSSGMRWTERGAAVVLTLRSLIYTEGRWEQFWNKADKYGFPVAA